MRYRLVDQLDGRDRQIGDFGRGDRLVVQVIGRLRQARYAALDRRRPSASLDPTASGAMASDVTASGLQLLSAYGAFDQMA